MTEQSRAHHIRSLFPQYEYGHELYYPPVPSYHHYPQQLSQPQQQQYNGYSNNYPYGNNNDDYEEDGEGEMSPQEIKALELELRRQNPDLLDKIRFAFKDRKYGTLFGQALKAAFYGAGIVAAPHIVLPMAAVQAISRSRKKQVQRRDMGIRPRYHIRPGDTY